MFIRLMLLFTIVPLLELALLIQIGKQIGLFSTLLIVISTGILGAFLAQQEGFAVIRKIQESISQGKLPTDSLLEGAMILAGGILLLTPGLITDTLGFILLLPITRAPIRDLIKRKFRQKLHPEEIDAKYTIDD
ncbi:MAG: FxsA family protein [Calditrichaeota bacterium]|nr:FxsA family protein [Calditrichota bacterium]